MNTNKILTFFLACLLLVGCDYNDKYFEGYDDGEITDVVNYKGEYAGDYPSGGYFTDRAALEKAVDAMLKAKFLYCDKGSTAKISVLYGDVTPGYQPEDVTYELVDQDYTAMGTTIGQPGRFKNFDKEMDIDGYLIEFCTGKYSSSADQTVVCIIYKYYDSGATTSEKRYYKKLSGSWASFDPTYATDQEYTLEAEDYNDMGTGYGQPGRYDNFDANMDIDHYLTIFLKNQYPYAMDGMTARVKYKYYAGGGTTNQSRVYMYNGNSWSYFDPYEATTDIMTKVAEMEFDGADWKLLRLMGGSEKLVLTKTEYGMLVDWVKVNKPDYMSKAGKNEEFYFGSANESNYQNINNSYNNWKDAHSEYGGLNTDQLQSLMDERMAWGISQVLLPVLRPTPDPGLTYVVVYNVYQGRGTGDYAMSFVYDEAEGTFALTGGPVKE